MSYLPLNKPFGSEQTIRNRAWHWNEDGGTDQYKYRYLAPCPGVTDDDGVYRHDCTVPAQPIVQTDLCGKPYRLGADFFVKTADGVGHPCGGRPR